MTQSLVLTLFLQKRTFCTQNMLKKHKKNVILTIDHLPQRALCAGRQIYQAVKFIGGFGFLSTIIFFLKFPCFNFFIFLFFRYWERCYKKTFFFSLCYYY